MKSEGDGGRQVQNAPQWICMTWPSKGATVGCKLELPWIFKTLKNVGALAFEQMEQLKQRHPELPSQASVGLHRVVRAPLHRVSASSDRTASISKNRSGFPFVDKLHYQMRRLVGSLVQQGKKEEAAVSLSQDELGELEARALAQAMARRKPATIIEFYSPRCKLCRSMVPVVAEVESKHEEWLHLVMADVENKRWLPEVLAYDIKYVPCFLLLDSYGNALAKTGVPHSRRHVLQGLMYLLESMRPITNSVRHPAKH